jgi:hypothetical protein
MSHDPNLLAPTTAAAEHDSSAASTNETPAWLRGPRSQPASFEERHLTGHLAGIDAEGRPLFVPEGSSEAVPVAIGMASHDGEIVRAARRQQRALVVATSDPQSRWVLVGFVRDRVSNAARDAQHGRLELAIDGEKVKLEAKHDIELRCGQASLTLRYDGRIELRGTHILSASRGPNRVKGATIALN